MTLATPPTPSLECAPDSLISKLHAQTIEHLHADRVDRATECAQALTSLRPNDPDAHTLLGLCLKGQRRWLHALPHLQRALELDPLHRPAALATAEILLVTKQTRAGLDLLHDVYTRGYNPNLPIDQQDITTLRASALLHTLDQLIKHPNLLQTP